MADNDNTHGFLRPLKKKSAAKIFNTVPTFDSNPTLEN